MKELCQTLFNSLLTLSSCRSCGSQNAESFFGEKEKSESEVEAKEDEGREAESRRGRKGEMEFSGFASWFVDRDAGVRNFVNSETS